MIGALLVRGMLAGLVAGILGFCFAWTVGEAPVDAAIAFEAHVASIAHADEHDDHDEDELVSRPMQSTAGLGTGTLIYGIAAGGIFALVFAAAYGRVAPFSARGTAALIGLLGFVACALVPFLKYPATPPAVGNPDTIQLRTALYLVLLVVSVAAMVLAVMLQKRLTPSFGGWNATLIAGAAYLVVTVVCYAVLPGINEIPQQALPSVVSAVGDTDITFPPTVLWSFRMASLGLHAVIWTTIALLFGALAQRQLSHA
jgi:hypothetical protein